MYLGSDMWKRESNARRGRYVPFNTRLTFLQNPNLNNMATVLLSFRLEPRTAIIAFLSLTAPSSSTRVCPYKQSNDMQRTTLAHLPGMAAEGASIISSVALSLDRRRHRCSDPEPPSSVRARRQVYSEATHTPTVRWEHREVTGALVPWLLTSDLQR